MPQYYNQTMKLCIYNIECILLKKIINTTSTFKITIFFPSMRNYILNLRRQIGRENSKII